MSKSRSRRKSNHNRTARRKRPVPARVERAMTSEDWANLRASADAETQGQAALAFDLYARISQFEHSLHQADLMTLAGLGDDAPGWLLSRWITLQVQRPLWTGSRPGVPVGTPAVVAVLETVYADGIEGVTAGELSPEVFVASLHQRDWMVRQLIVYEHGGLRSFLEEQAGRICWRAPTRSTRGWRRP